MTTGQRIKAARMKAGLTQKELGAKLGVSESFIAQYETDKRNPKIETLEKIACALGVHPGELQGFVNYGDDPWAPGYDIWAPPGISHERLEHLRDLRDQVRANQQEFQVFQRVQVDQDISGIEILDYYNRLNDSGKQVAVERVKELTEIPRYQKESQQTQQSPQVPQEGTDTTPPKDAPETPPEGPTEQKKG